MEPPAAGATLSTNHPVDLVLDAFKNPESVQPTMHKLKVFLEEALKVQGKKMECSAVPATSRMFRRMFLFRKTVTSFLHVLV